MSQAFAGGIGRRIARYRKMNRWSAQQLANNTDGALTRDTIANIENGRRADITVRQLLAAALALRIPPTALLTDLEHPLEPSDIRFPGSAPAPLDHTAPQIAVANWLNGQGENDTTNAARWVTRVTTLLADYLAAVDTTEVQSALHRISLPAHAHEDAQRVAQRRRTLRAELLAEGVQLPPEVDEPGEGTH